MRLSSVVILLESSVTLVQSLGFYLEPIKQREIKSPKDLEKAFECFRYKLDNSMTVIDVLTGGEITNQKLNILIQDQYGNILRQKDDIKGYEVRIVFKPEADSIVDICFINIVSDASWSNKGVVREMLMEIEVFDSKPKYDYNEMKEINQNLQSNNQILIDDVEKKLTKFENELKYLVKREHQLRDLNESIFNKLMVFIIVFSGALAVSQITIFVYLRRFAPQ